MFCNYCKTKADDGQKFCSSCGKSLIPGVSGESRVGPHLKPLGIFWIVFSSFRLIGGVATLVVGMLVIPFLTSEFPIAESILRTVISLVGGGLLLTAIAGLAAGFGLLGTGQERATIRGGHIRQARKWSFILPLQERYPRIGKEY